MNQRIHLAAIIRREDRLLLLRASPSAPWELPGGAFERHHPDPEAGMDAILRGLGIEAPVQDEHFLETVYLPDGDGHMVYNIYAPPGWRGGPCVPPGTGTGWFAPHELESIEMDALVRESLLVTFGLREPRDRTVEIIAALSGSDFAADQAPPGEVSGYPALRDKMRSLQAIAMLAALGRSGSLRAHIAAALDQGVAPGQIVETLRLVGDYAGFPAAMEAWTVMERVFERRGISQPGALR